MGLNNVISYRSGPISSVSMGLPGDHEGKSATRAFFVQGSGRLALIDSGIYAGYPSLIQAFREIGRQPGDLDLLLNTHEHMDHVGNNGPLKRDTGCRILGHEARADRIADNMLNAETIVHAFPAGRSFDLKSEYLDWMAPFEGPLDGFLEDGDQVELGGKIVLEAVECFGHSMGELGFFEHSSRSLIIADPLLPDFNPVLYLYEDPTVMRQTFDKLERFLKERDVQTVIPAHDEPCDADSAADLIADCRRRVDDVERSIVRHIDSDPGIGFAALRDRVCEDNGKVPEWRALISIDASVRAFESEGRFEMPPGWRSL